MSDIGEYLIRSTRERINEGITPEGSRFAPKSQSTISNYITNGYSKGAASGPLIRTGDMLSMSLHQSSGRDFAEVASSAVYAAVMQLGAPKGSLGSYSGTDKNGRNFHGAAPWGDIPVRPFFCFSDTDRESIGALIADAMEQAWGAAK